MSNVIPAWKAECNWAKALIPFSVCPAHKVILLTEYTPIISTTLYAPQHRVSIGWRAPQHRVYVPEHRVSPFSYAPQHRV